MYYIYIYTKHTIIMCLKKSSSEQGFSHPLKAIMMLQGFKICEMSFIESNIGSDMGDSHLRAELSQQKHLYALNDIFMRNLSLLP